MRASLAAIAAASALTACISDAPVVPVTPQNQAQVSTCQGIASLHNGVVISGLVVGGLTSGASGVSAAVSDSQTKTDLAIGAAVAGGLALVATGVAAVTGADFSNSKCTDVVGPLPAERKP